MSEAPEIIYLQWIPEKTWYDDTVTWCEDEINDDDIEYIKASTATRLRGLLRRVEWIPDVNGRTKFDWCPICEQVRGLGHAADCELAKEISGG